MLIEELSDSDYFDEDEESRPGTARVNISFRYIILHRAKKKKQTKQNKTKQLYGLKLVTDWKTNTACVFVFFFSNFIFF